MKKLFLTTALALLVCAVNAQEKEILETVSKKEQVASPKIKVFPNPATRVINVLGLLNSDAAQITISDLYGKILVSHEWEIRNKALNINIANLESGIYMIVIRSKEQQVTTKFYKQ